MKRTWKQVTAAGIAALALTLNTLPFDFVAYAGQQLGQTNFDDGVGLPWHVCESAPGEMEFTIQDGTYNITIVNPGGASKGGEDRWDCQFRHRGLTLESGCTYTVSYDITASNACSYYTKIGDMGEPYAEDWHGEPDDGQHESYWDVKQLSANQKVSVTGTFTAKRTAEVEWAFHIGGDSVPVGTVFTFDNMSLVSSGSTYDYVPEEEWVRSDILTNQLGYFEKLSKKATLLSDASKGVEFYVKDEGGKTVYTGTSEPKGEDKDSGDAVHELNFSDLTDSGTYYLETEDGAKSRTFEIGGGKLYSGMLYDALNYFYQNRSGVEIESDYIISGDASSLARAAGHNPDSASIMSDWEATSGGSKQDVTGGWYDAGDHGKYVVNGGISLWTMQNQYERALQKGDASMYDDGTMSIPENSNGNPDLLDEARYEMEWFLKMIVKDGTYKDMVYHKVHDVKWTALALAPADDAEERIIKPPTTAATLNLAACGAQAARLWEEYDSAFATECLNAAKAAYTAAKANPKMFAPLDQSVGGGAYGDDNVTDEFYWAACELYATTGDESYLKDAQASDFYLALSSTVKGGEDVGTVAGMNWGNTAALGSLTLALTEAVDGKDADALKGNIESAADDYVKLSEEQGYGQPYGQSTVAYNDSQSGYVWGSNSAVANNGIVLAYAYDLSGDDKYLAGALSAMDYLLGRNPLDYSYVTGYGSHSVKNPHHRYWSHQVEDSFPSAPNGILVGGPNSGMQDPWVKGSGWKPGEIAPAKCYLDHVEAWSVNECTINWNTPLAWMSAFAAEQGGGIVVTNGSGGAASKQEDKNEAAGSNSSKKQDTDKDDSQDKTVAASTKESGKKSDVWIIVLAALVGLVSVEVFVLKLVKMKKAGGVAPEAKVGTDAAAPAPDKTDLPPQA